MLTIPGKLGTIPSISVFLAWSFGPYGHSVSATVWEIISIFIVIIIVIIITSNTASRDGRDARDWLTGLATVGAMSALGIVLLLGSCDIEYTFLYS